jgi:hypothetical protein
MSAALQSYWRWLNTAPALDGVSWHRL